MAGKKNIMISPSSMEAGLPLTTGDTPAGEPFPASGTTGRRIQLGTCPQPGRLQVLCLGLLLYLHAAVAHTPPRHAGQDERRLEVSHVGKNGSKAHAQGVFAAPASSY